MKKPTPVEKPIQRGKRPAYRYLRGFVLDPGFSTKLDTARINQVVYRIPFEELGPGPVGEYVEVMDVDPASGCWYEPVDLGEEYVASQQGLTPSEGDPQFHQQLVYAVTMKTIGHFERALGRKVIWKPRIYHETGGPPKEQPDQYAAYEPRLRMHPHAFRDANAYYAPERIAVLFGYFDAADQLVGSNLPGGTVFTCCSPDIIAHEVTHAILDSIHHRYMEETNYDVGGFHEGFADIVALLSRFTFSELVEHQLFHSEGRLDRYTVLGELATQFGEGLEGYSGALRSAIGEWVDGTWNPQQPSPSDYRKLREVHDRGALLVATVFDAFQRVYTYRTRDLVRIATNGTGVLPNGSISRDLVQRLAREASTIAGQLLHICIRALDYAPPWDITYGNYLRALITADMDIAPEDELGYRLALVEAFRARGIFPDRVSSLSPESLRWSTLETDATVNAHFKDILTTGWTVPAKALRPGEKPYATNLITLIRELAVTQDRERVYHLSQVAQELFKVKLQTILDTQERDVSEAFLKKMGLTAWPLQELFEDEDAKKEAILISSKKDGLKLPPPIEVHSIRPAFRTGREGRQVEQVVVTLSQTVRVKDPEHPRRDPVVFRGGATLILNLGELGRLLDEGASVAEVRPIEYAIVKNVRSWRRFKAQRQFQQGGGGHDLAAAQNTYEGPAREEPLNMRNLHRH